MTKYSILLSLLILSSCGTLNGIRMKNKEDQNKQKISANKEDHQYHNELQEIPVFSRSSNLEVTEIEKSVEDDEVPNQIEAKKPIATSTQAFEQSLDLRYSPKLFNWWINFFTKREKARFNRHLNNGFKYKDVVKAIFKEHGLPSDLYYVGLIESGFNTYVRSHAGATGPWQFMRGTARDYGLRVDGSIDERANLVKATHAAARYFKDLYNIFLSWELVLCAYNAGEYRIIGAIRRGNTRDYRELVKKKLLPKETIYYIPKVAAAKAITDAPEKYGFAVNYKSFNPYKDHIVKNVNYSFNSRKLAKALKVPYQTFKKMNPDIRHANVRVRKKRRGFDILLPKNISTSFAEAKTTGEFQIQAPKHQGSRKRKSAVYKVRRGDNLYKIARRLGVSVKDLKQINNIRGSKIMVGQRLRTKASSIRKPSRATKSKGYIARKSSSKRIVHRVRRGENLTSIAKKYGTSVSSIRRLNRFRRKVLFVGQKINVPVSSLSYYTVRRGDNLNKIANKFGVPVTRLKSANNIRGSRIFIGQRVLIPSNG